MTAAEIDDALENNPSGSDLEIALAIGTGEGDIRKRRAELKKKAAAKFLKTPEPAGPAGNQGPGPHPIGTPEFTQPGPGPHPAGASGVPASEPEKPQRYFVRDPETNAQVEVRRVNSNPRLVIFERIIPIPIKL